MGRDNISMVKYNKLWLLGLVALAVIVGIFAYNNFKSQETEASFKPMVKVEDEVYYWSEDLTDLDTEKYEFIGEIKVSQGSLSFKLEADDENLSTNIYPLGTKVYRYDGETVLVVLKDGLSLLRVMR